MAAACKARPTREGGSTHTAEMDMGCELLLWNDELEIIFVFWSHSNKQEYFHHWRWGKVIERDIFSKSIHLRLPHSLFIWEKYAACQWTTIFLLCIFSVASTLPWFVHQIFCRFFLSLSVYWSMYMCASKSSFVSSVVHQVCSIFWEWCNVIAGKRIWTVL